MIEAAVIDPTSLPSAAQYLPGYDGQLHLGPLLWLLLRLSIALYLLASALAAFDRRNLTGFDIILRLIIAAFIMFKPIEFHAPALCAAIVLLALHIIKNKTVESPFKATT